MLISVWRDIIIEMSPLKIPPYLKVDGKYLKGLDLTVMSHEYVWFQVFISVCMHVMFSKIE